MPQDRENVAPYPAQARPGAIGFSRSMRQRPDGTFETRDRWIYGRERTAPEPDLSTTKPTCDAPHCVCQSGEDCQANALVEVDRTVVIDSGQKGITLQEDPVAGTIAAESARGGRVPIVVKGREVILAHGGYSWPISVTYRASSRAGSAFGDDWRYREAIGQRHLLCDVAAAVTVLGDRLDGLNAKLDALAVRKADHDAHMIRVVMPSEVDRDCDRDTETWYLDPAFQGHAAPFAMGDAVTDSSAYLGLFQVLSVRQRYGDKKIELRLRRHPGFLFDTEAF